MAPASSNNKSIAKKTNHTDLKGKEYEMLLIK